jgi:hypothetical protein
MIGDEICWQLHLPENTTTVDFFYDSGGTVPKIKHIEVDSVSFDRIMATPIGGPSES